MRNTLLAGWAAMLTLTQPANWAQAPSTTDSATQNYQIGYSYEYGTGDTPKDYATAALYLKKAAASDYAPAQYELGILYKEGLGVPKNITEAAHMWQQAAKQGNPQALQALRMLCAYGLGPSSDYDLARSRCRLAAIEGLVRDPDQSDQGESNQGENGSRADSPSPSETATQIADLQQEIAAHNAQLTANQQKLQQDQQDLNNCRGPMAYLCLSIDANAVAMSQQAVSQEQATIAEDEQRLNAFQQSLPDATQSGSALSPTSSDCNVRREVKCPGCPVSPSCGGSSNVVATPSSASVAISDNQSAGVKTCQELYHLVSATFTTSPYVAARTRCEVLGHLVLKNLSGYSLTCDWKIQTGFGPSGGVNDLGPYQNKSEGDYCNPQGTVSYSCVDKREYPKLCSWSFYEKYH